MKLGRNDGVTKPWLPCALAGTTQTPKSPVTKPAWSTRMSRDMKKSSPKVA
jgi:hypothetical protein